MQIYYNIINLNIHTSLNINQIGCITINDVQKLIANSLKISDRNLIIQEPYPIIKEYSTFNFFIRSLNNSVNFVLPNKTIVIQNFNKTKFNHILEHMQREGLYIDNSEKCLPFQIVGNSKNDFYVKFDFNSDKIILEFDSKIFIFTDFEIASYAYRLLKSIYRNSNRILIIEDDSKKMIPKDIFDKNKDYSIKIEGLAKQSKQLKDFPKSSPKPLFYSIDPEIDSKKIPKFEQKQSKEPKNDQKNYIKDVIKSDKKIFKKTSGIKDKNVSDLIDYPHKYEEKKQSPLILPKKPEILSNQRKSDLDSKKQKNQATSELIKKAPKAMPMKASYTKSIENDSDSTTSNSNSIQKVDQIESQIKVEEIPIIFIIEGTQKGKQFYPLHKRLNPEMKIKDVKKIISNERKIEGEIAICYKERDVNIRIDHEMTIDDVRDEMKAIENEKPKNYLYVEFIQPKQKVTPKRPNQKSAKENKNKNDDDDDDDDEPETKFSTRKNKQRKLKEKAIASNSDDDDDSYDQISIEKSKNKIHDEDQQSDKANKYFYQINNDSTVHEIELDSDATVKTMKIKIAEKNGVDDISKIKIIFAGKEILDDINLEDLEIGNISLFVYIQTLEEVLLMTAKALKV